MLGDSVTCPPHTHWPGCNMQDHSGGPVASVPGEEGPVLHPMLMSQLSWDLCAPPWGCSKVLILAGRGSGSTQESWPCRPTDCG